MLIMGDKLRKVLLFLFVISLFFSFVLVAQEEQSFLKRYPTDQEIRYLALKGGLITENIDEISFKDVQYMSDRTKILSIIKK